MKKIQRAAASQAATKKTKVGGGRPAGTVRCVYHVWVWLDSETNAVAMGRHLYSEKPKLNDEPERGMKVFTWDTEGNLLKLVIDYTTTGNAPCDIYRQRGDKRPGMLNRVARRLGVEIRDAKVDEQSRVAVNLG